MGDHAMDVIAKSMSNDDAEEDVEGADLRRWVASLAGKTQDLTRLLEMLEQWNSNRKMAPLSQMLMGLVLEVVPPAKLAAVEGMNATCGNFLSYSARHMARVDALLQKTFLFDLAIQSAGGLVLPASADKESHAVADAS